MTQYEKLQSGIPSADFPFVYQRLTRIAGAIQKPLIETKTGAYSLIIHLVDGTYELFRHRVKGFA